MIFFFEFPIIFIVIIIMMILGLDIIPIISFICLMAAVFAMLWWLVTLFDEERAWGCLIFSVINFLIVIFLDLCGAKLCLWDILF